MNQFEKLSESDNYASWATSLELFLRLQNLSFVIEDSLADIANREKVPQCRALIILSVEHDVQIHFDKADKPRKIWDDLKSAFQDNSLLKKGQILRQFWRTQLDKCDNEEEYIGKIISAARRLRNIGMIIPDHWVANILLMGPSDIFEPMVIAIENSGAVFTVDWLKRKFSTMSRIVA